MFKDENIIWRIDKIFRKCKVCGKEEVLVWWLGWFKKFDSWILKVDIKEIWNELIFLLFEKMLMWMVFKLMDSFFVYYNNRLDDFRVCLFCFLFLMGDWIVELMEFCNMNIKLIFDKEIFVYCFVCDDSFVGEC